MTRPPLLSDQISADAAVPESSPVGRSAPRRLHKHLAVAAFVGAWIGAVFAIVPGSAWLSLVVFALTLPLSLVAMRKKAQGGTAFGVAAMAISILGCAVAITLLLGTLQPDPLTELEAQQLREELLSPPGKDAAPERSPKKLPPLQPASPPLLTFAEAGFGRDPLTGEWWYAFIVENGDVGQTHVDTPITAVALGADQAPLQSELLSLSFEPGRTVVAGFFTDVRDSDVVSIDSVISTPPFSVSGPGTQLLAVGNVSETIDSQGIAAVKGDVTNLTDSPLEHVAVTAVAYDTDGTILGFARVGLEALTANETRAIEARFAHALPTGATFEVFAQQE
ncbi:hypothetical protein JOD62_001602 [Microbacterium keratanolyticum]|uniref:FxLYD domain-containing protein n=1 Tax=Microbacterium keratanolyticum TaxID=67574 RepID=UPI00195C81F6|nr:FxLYD domain-containing protein [Microbacterium keratanolyticum]MBM7469054.1 hypothetical protein [Microbacterium keratanolyticum]